MTRGAVPKILERRWNSVLSCETTGPHGGIHRGVAHWSIVMYDASDPRSKLSAGGAQKPAATEFAAADYAKFSETAPQEEAGAGRGTDGEAAG